MGDERTFKGKMEVAGVVGPLWFAAWLFMIGYLNLSMPKLLYAIIFWPYYLGVHFR
jgi:hypothetical protein